MSARPDCELCASSGGDLIWADARCRVIRVDDASFPGYCRVIWREHVEEMTDLAADERHHLMTVVAAVESAVRETARPDKINLASFGNMVAHLHWHIIPRWRDDSHFPQPIWGSRQRAGTARAVDPAALAENICERLAVPTL